MTFTEDGTSSVNRMNVSNARLRLVVVVWRVAGKIVLSGKKRCQVL
jgi:hypothetical protein